MTSLRDAAQAALEVLETPIHEQSFMQKQNAITALKAALAEPVQEPVAWLTPRTLDSYMRPDLGYETCSKSDYGAFPVYNSPPQQKPLTEEEIHDCWQQRHRDKTTERRLITRAIEQAHGIKE